MNYSQKEIEEAATIFILRQRCDTCPIWERCERQRYCTEVFKEAFAAGEIDLRGAPIKKGDEK